jgi:uncharacterized protein (DUF362 family)
LGAVYEQFERELAAWQRKYAARPEREAIKLFLLALEREELVTVGYGEELMDRRLSSMPLSAPARDLIRHALIWILKDEEMHATYVRGVIFKFEKSVPRALAFLKQIAGSIGGWASSVRQHVRWSEAPLSRAFATAITWLGLLSGRVPRDVRQYLTYGSFRDFCRFNIDAEKTAWLCFQRVVELVAARRDLPLELLDDFRRIQEDEDRHRMIFELLASVLDDQGRLAPGLSEEELAHRIKSVGEEFLPRSFRNEIANGSNPLGGGGRVFVCELPGSPSTEERVAAFIQTLEESRLGARLEDQAGRLGKAAGDLRVAIKVGFMMGYDRKDRSPVVNPDLLRCLVEYLRGYGCREIVAIETSNIYDDFFRNRSVAEVAAYFQIGSPGLRIVDSSQEQVPHAYTRGLGQYSVGASWKDADFRISFGKMRSHPVEMVYLSMGNLEGLGARCSDFFFSERQADRDTAAMMTLAEFPPHFAILDASTECPDGLLGVMGCPAPKSPLRFYAGADAIAVDVVAARHMGLERPLHSRLLRAARHWFGDPSEHIEVVGCDRPLTTWRGPYHNEISTLLSFLAYPVYQFGSHRGALFVPEMDEEAFPAAAPEGMLLRTVRRLLRALLGLRHAKR